ncbi:MAG: hypothetical protein ACYTG0_34600 [Planctomycetota bacterium]|jgi:hypothetical protein
MKETSGGRTEGKRKKKRAKRAKRRRWLPPIRQAIAREVWKILAPVCLPIARHPLARPVAGWGGLILGGLLLPGDLGPIGLSLILTATGLLLWEVEGDQTPPADRQDR